MKAGLAVILSATLRPVAVPVNPAAAPLSPSAALAAPVLAAPAALTPLSPLALPLPVALTPVQAVPAAPEPLRAMPALQAFSALPAPSVGDAFDGAFAERREKKAEAVQHAHAEIPVVDYVRGSYSREGAAEMMETSFVIDETKNMTGSQLLSLVVTPEALDPDLTPDPDRVDFGRLGKTSAQIRATLEEAGVPYHNYERWLGAAFREGLLYRLFNRNTGLTYYGVPPRVRADWGLEAPTGVPAAKAPAAPVSSAFSDALKALAADAETLPKHEELFEFTAQAVDAAIAEGRFPAGAVSAKFRARADSIGYDVPSLKDAVLTLAESAEGTPWEAKTAALAALLD